MKIGVVGEQCEIEKFRNILHVSQFGLYVNCFDTSEIGSDLKGNAMASAMYKSFLNSVDVVILANSLDNKTDFAIRSIKASKHVYIQYPFLIKIKDIEKLIHLANEANIVLKFEQTGKHNFLLKNIKEEIIKPNYIMVERAYSAKDFNKNKDHIISYLLYDIEISMNLSGSNVRRVIPFIQHDNSTKQPNMISTRIEFEDGCIAQLLFNSIATREVHLARIFQSDSYMELDFITNYLQKISKETQETLHFPLGEAPTSGEYITNSDLKTFFNIIKQKNSFILSEYDSYKSVYVMAEILNNFKRVKKIN